MPPVVFNDVVNIIFCLSSPHLQALSVLILDLPSGIRPQVLRIGSINKSVPNSGANLELKETLFRSSPGLSIQGGLRQVQGYTMPLTPVVLFLGTKESKRSEVKVPNLRQRLTRNLDLDERLGWYGT